MAKKEDIKVKTDDQLATQLGELKREQFNLRFQSATNQLEKPSPGSRGAPHHRPDQDAADRSLARRGQGVRSILRCQSASSPAPWCPTRVTRRWWSVSSGG